MYALELWIHSLRTGRSFSAPPVGGTQIPQSTSGSFYYICLWPWYAPLQETALLSGSLGSGPGASSMRSEKILPFLQCRIRTIILVLPHNGLFGGSNGRQNVCMCVESGIATHLSCTMGQNGARVQETATGLWPQDEDPHVDPSRCVLGKLLSHRASVS